MTAGRGCGDFSANALPVRARVEQVTEAARRAGVFPGVIRDLRRRYRLTWDDRRLIASIMRP